MFGIHDFWLFLAAGILLNLTPGPDTVYILGRTITQGREAGIASALGISLGSIFHTGCCFGRHRPSSCLLHPFVVGVLNALCVIADDIKL